MFRLIGESPDLLTDMSSDDIVIIDECAFAFLVVVVIIVIE